LADAVLVAHFGVVLFVVGGLVAVLVGNWRRWGWVNTWWFRLSHLGAIAFVVVQSWLGQVCPLTKLETWLREQAGSASYNRSFVEHWLQQLIFYEAPFWVFAMAYTAFGLMVILAWWYFPPRRRTDRRNGS
jgi:H+/Cl- antiporter ClcA